jgi:hypothetical protein
MAKEVLELTVKSNIGEVTKETDDLGKSIGKASDETKDLDKGLEDAGKSGKKGFEAIGTAVKGFGVALKAAGIGLVIALFTTLKEALERNQTVMNGVSTIMTTVSTTFNQVVDTLIDVVSWVTASQDRFDGLTKVVTSLMTIALTPLKLSFYAIKGAVLGAMLAWEDSFLGGGDQDKMAALRSELKTTGDDIKQIGLDAIAAGKEVVENVGDAITEIGAIGEMVIDQISQISVKANYEMAAATTAAANSSKLAEAQIQGLIEKNDLLAETQRQIRDDETKTFAERIEANKKIGEILDDQEKEMIKLADTRVNAAALELAANKDNIDLQVAYQATLNDRAGVEAQIAGFRSEQLTNEVSLNKELAETQKEITNATLEGIALELEELKNSYEMQLEMARKAGEDTTALDEKYAKDKKAILEASAKNEEAILDEAAKNEKDRKKALQSFNVGMAQQGLQVIADAAGEGTALAKAAAIAQATISGVQGVQNAFTSANANIGATAGSFGAYPVTMAALAGVFAAANIAKIASGSPASPSDAPPPPSTTTPAPQMMSGAFQLGGGVKPEPMKAFVVTDEMSNSQSQLANIRRRATI